MEDVEGLCLCLCYPSLHVQCNKESMSTSTRKGNSSIFLCLWLCLHYYVVCVNQDNASTSANTRLSHQFTHIGFLCSCLRTCKPGFGIFRSCVALVHGCCLLRDTIVFSKIW